MRQAEYRIESGGIPVWTILLVAFTMIALAGCKNPTSPSPAPNPNPEYILNLSDTVPTCTEGDTIWVTAKVPSDSSHQPLGFSNFNAEIAAVLNFISDTARISCRKAGGADIEVQWTDGVIRLTDTIKVTVTAPTHRIIKVRTGYASSDLFKNPFGLRVVVAWRFPSRDSVVGTIDAEGAATFPVLREIADVMDTVTVSASGSAFHFPVKAHFRRAVSSGVSRFRQSSSEFVYEVGGYVTPAADPRFNFVISSKTYTVPLGRDAGQTVQVSIEKLYQKGPTGSPWMRMRGIPVQADKYPLTMCFDRVKSNIPITAFDSTAWADGMRDSLHSVLGIQLFRFGTTNCDRKMVADSTLSSYSADTTGIYVHETPVHLVARFGTESALRTAAHVLTHEGMHAVGIGHTDAWTGVMNTTGGAWITLMDAAMFHLSREMSLAATQMGGALGLEAANEALK
jgi:hypothetical protein